MEQVDYSSDPTKGTQIFYSDDWMGVSRATGGGLCRFGTPHELVGRECRLGHTVGVSGDWFFGPEF